MAFFQSTVGILQTHVIALGAGLGIWDAMKNLQNLNAFFLHFNTIINMKFD